MPETVSETVAQQQVDTAPENTKKELLAEAKRYPALILMSTLLKIASGIILFLSIILAVVVLFVVEGVGDKILAAFGTLGIGIITFVVFYFLSELIKVIVDIEENTRKVAEQK